MRRESDFYNDNWCARCRSNIEYARETGVSSLYNPGGKAILLCKPCYDEEDYDIEEEGNDRPKDLANYMANLASFPY